ncbi:MAG: hypothetical protein AAF289_05640 [Cyanobacteria bacterium P01_A01_bin.135]
MNLLVLNEALRHGALWQAPFQLGNSAQGVKRLAAAADRASSAIADLVGSTTARAAASLDQGVIQAEGITSRLAQDLWRAISTDVDRWLGQHVVLAWLLTHPLVALCLGFIGVVLLWSLVQAAAQLAQRGWALVLGLPLYIIRLSWRAGGHLLRWLITALRQRGQRQTPAPDASDKLSPAEPPASFDSVPEVRLLGDAVPLTDVREWSQGDRLWCDTRQQVARLHSNGEVLEALKRLEALSQAQTHTLQHLIHLLESPAPVSAVEDRSN